MSHNSSQAWRDEAGLSPVPAPSSPGHVFLRRQQTGHGGLYSWISDNATGSGVRIKVGSGPSSEIVLGVWV